MGDEHHEVVDYRLGRVEHRVKNLEAGTRLLAELGAKSNEQINTLRDEVHEMKPEVAKVAVLDERVASMLDGWRAVRNAFLAAAGGLVILAGTILYQATS